MNTKRVNEMPRHCSVCDHPKQAVIDASLVNGEPFRDIARRYRLTASSIHRHRQSHLPEQLVRAEAAREVSKSSELFSRIGNLEAQAQRLGDKAESEGDLRTALAGVRELARLAELVVKINNQQSA